MKQLLHTAIQAAISGGEEILKVYKTEFLVEKKDDRSPLTLADKNSHAVINQMLSATGIPVLSEEGKDIPFIERKNWKHLWIVDPLDGTKEFVKRNGEFTVNIALAEMGIPVLGVIYIPVSGTLYFASKETGALVCRHITGPSDVTDEDKLLLSAHKLPLIKKTGKFTIVASRSHINPETEDYINDMRKKHGDIEIISAGSSIKFCLVAEGRADVYPRFGPTMEWDTAAGQVIVECMGKKVVDIATGNSLTYNRENLKNGSFLVE